MKQIGSVITGLPKANSKQTGQQHGVIGYDDLSSLPEPSISEPPIELATIITDSTQRLMTFAFKNQALGLYENKNISLSLIEEGVRELTLAHSAAQQALPPVTKEKIADALNSFAEMLQCPVPKPEGLKLYFHALKDMPYYKFQEACFSLIKTHKWPRLPLPADFLAAGENARPELDTALSNLKYTKGIFELALEHRTKDKI